MFEGKFLNRSLILGFLNKDNLKEEKIGTLYSLFRSTDHNSPAMIELDGLITSQENNRILCRPLKPRKKINKLSDFPISDEKKIVIPKPSGIPIYVFKNKTQLVIFDGYDIKSKFIDKIKKVLHRQSIQPNTINDGFTYVFYVYGTDLDYPVCSYKPKNQKELDIRLYSIIDNKKNIEINPSKLYNSQKFKHIFVKFMDNYIHNNLNNINNLSKPNAFSYLDYVPFNTEGYEIYYTRSGNRYVVYDKKCELYNEMAYCLTDADIYDETYLIDLEDIKKYCNNKFYEFIKERKNYVNDIIENNIHTNDEAIIRSQLSYITYHEKIIGSFYES